MSLKAFEWAAAQKDLGVSGKAVLMVMAALSDARGVYDGGLTKLADCACCSEAMAAKAVRLLTARGLVEVRKRFAGNDEIRLNIEIIRMGQ